MPHRALTSGRLLARNIGMNVVGGSLPAIAAIVAVPPLVRAMGDARFGILALAWTTLGYFSLFDLGFGRAITQAVARRLGDGREHELPEILWTALAILAPITIAGAVSLAVLAPWLTSSVLKVPLELQSEAVTAFRLLAIAIPFSAASAALRGVLEAKQRFGLVNALRTPFGVLTFLGPVATLPFSHSLVPAAGVLVAGRTALAIAHFVACARVVPGFGAPQLSRVVARALLGYGGWMTVSNVVSPFMNTLDRYVVAAFLSVTAVTYYATPHELATKMWLLTAAVLPVFFPAFATSGIQNAERTARLFDRSLRLVFLTLFLPTFILVLLAPEILLLWLSPEFAAQSSTVLRVLALAVFVNTLGQGALTLLQSLERPDITGKLHLVELPIYAALLWFLLPRWGIVGVAVAWAVRAIVDAALLLAACPRVLKESQPTVQRIGLWLVAGAGTIWAATAVPGVAARVWLAVFAVPAWGAIVWWGILRPEERMSPISAFRPASTGD